MELINYKRNCLGTMDFIMKVGKMKKAESFITYPIQKNDNGAKIYFQSSHRWAEMETATGKIIMSARRERYANPCFLMSCIIKGTAERDQATPEQLAEILDAIRGTASPHAGGNNALHLYCDNSNAANI